MVWLGACFSPSNVKLLRNLMKYIDNSRNLILNTTLKIFPYLRNQHYRGRKWIVGNSTIFYSLFSSRDININSEMSLRELDKALLTPSVYNILYKYGPKKQEEIKLLAECITNFQRLSHIYQISCVLWASSIDSALKAIETDF